MSYTTPTGMAAAFGAKELAEVCDRDHAPFLVTADVFALAAAGGDLSGEPADVQAAAAAALARCQGAIDRAGAEIDSRLACATALPLAAAAVEANGLAGRCADIARYLLHDDAKPEHVEAGYKDALAWLRDIAAGRACLLADAVHTPPQRVRTGQARSGFDWGRY